MNLTSWGTGKSVFARLQEQGVAAVLFQEHRLRTAEEISEASQWLLKRGWESLWAPAGQGDKNGPSGGVGVATRALQIGLGPILDTEKGATILDPHRAMAARLRAPGYPDFAVISVYLDPAAGFAPKASTLEAVGSFITDTSLPVLLGGDFNMAPPVILRSGWPQRWAGQALHTSAATCLSSRSRDRLLVCLAGGGCGCGGSSGGHGGLHSASPPCCVEAGAPAGLAEDVGPQEAWPSSSRAALRAATTRSELGRGGGGSQAGHRHR